MARWNIYRFNGRTHSLLIFGRILVEIKRTFGDFFFTERPEHVLSQVWDDCFSSDFVFKVPEGAPRSKPQVAKLRSMTNRIGVGERVAWTPSTRKSCREALSPLPNCSRRSPGPTGRQPRGWPKGLRATIFGKSFSVISLWSRYYKLPPELFSEIGKFK